MRHASQSAEERLDPAPDRTAGDVVGAHHHIDAIAGLGREPLPQQALRLLGVRARQRRAVDVSPPKAADSPNARPSPRSQASSTIPAGGRTGRRAGPAARGAPVRRREWRSSGRYVSVMRASVGDVTESIARVDDEAGRPFDDGTRLRSSAYVPRSDTRSSS